MVGFAVLFVWGLALSILTIKIDRLNVRRIVIAALVALIGQFLIDSSGLGLLSSMKDTTLLAFLFVAAYTDFVEEQITIGNRILLFVSVVAGFILDTYSGLAAVMIEFAILAATFAVAYFLYRFHVLGSLADVAVLLAVVCLWPSRVLFTVMLISLCTILYSIPIIYYKRAKRKGNPGYVAFAPPLFLAALFLLAISPVLNVVLSGN